MEDLFAYLITGTMFALFGGYIGSTEFDGLINPKRPRIFYMVTGALVGGFGVPALLWVAQSNPSADVSTSLPYGQLELLTYI